MDEEKSKVYWKIVEKIEEPKYYKHSSHATYNFTWHFVWITKYRRKVLSPEIIKRLETIIRWVCNEQYITILWLGFEEDHVHCLLSLPITAYIPDVLRYLKWRTSKVIWKEFPKHLKEYYRSKSEKHLWAVWYFFCSVWKVNEDIIKQYVENQWREDSRGEEISFS